MILVGIWEVTSSIPSLPEFMFPSFLQVMQTIVEGIVSGQILSAIGISLGRLLIGFISASIIGLILGYLIWKYKLIEDTLGFLITALQSIPSIVWFPLAIIWFGLNNYAILFIVMIGATWTVTLSAVSGFKNVPVLYQQVAQTLGSKGFHFLKTVIFPSAVPQLISGFRIAWAFSWRALMAGELLGASSGLGQLLDAGRSLGQMDLVIAVMIIIGIIGTIVDHLLFTKIETNIQRKWGLN